ncbi:CRE-LSY-12 protein, partial [Caenorhabditis remanei]
MSSTATKRRNTNNSRCASLLMASTTPTVTRKSALVDSDDDDDDDEMSSNGESSELAAHRSRTPRGRYSPMLDERNRRTNSRMSALSIDTHRNTDLNADGSAPSSSSAASSAFLTPDINRPPPPTVSHKKRAPHSTGRRKKMRNYPSSSAQNSQGETELDSDDEDQRDTDNMSICNDDDSYKIFVAIALYRTWERCSVERACNKVHESEVPSNNRKKFQESQITVQGECEFSKSEIAEIFKKGDQQARLPERIQIGTVIMKTWYGSPFPAEFINVRQLYICEFCFFYARSDLIMQNHAKRCKLRAPPGVEIYRKDDVSVFEVDGRRQKSYCQTLCLISRMFLESKTVFYDTEPFFFYVATKNDAHGCHFTGYFSKEKYEPDVNNLSCIMTLPCYQDQGYGRFLIDLSYALSRREGWNGGPEQPLSDLGKKAYGGYWKNTIAVSLVKMKDRIEYGGRGICIGGEQNVRNIANDTGINSHDVLSVVCSLGWAKIVDPKNGGKVCTLEWDVDWDVCHAIDEQRRKAGGGGKTQFDEKCLDTSKLQFRHSTDMRNLRLARILISSAPRESNPCGNTKDIHKETGVETAKNEATHGRISRIDERGDRRRRATPSEKSSEDTDSHDGGNGGGDADEFELSDWIREKKTCDRSVIDDVIDDELRSRGHNRTTAGRNLKLELTRKVKVPTEVREITDDDETQRVEDKKSHKKRKSFTRCADDVPDPQKRHEGTPDDDDQPGPSTSKSLGRRPRSTREQVESTASASSEQKTPNGRGRYRRRRGGKAEDSDDEPTEDEAVSTDEEAELTTTPRPHQAPEKGKPRGRKPGKKRKSVSGKKFPPNFGVREDKKTTEVVESEEEKVEKKQEEAELEKTTAGSEAEEIDLLHDAIDEDMMKNYNIGTPESYHSNSPSPAPPPEMPPPQEPPVEEDPPLLISEVNNLTVAEPVEPMDEGQPTAPPPLIADTFGDDDDDDDDVPPNLSPQYEKNEVHEEEVEMAQVAPQAPPPQQHQTPNQHSHNSHNGIHQEESYHDSMSVAGTSSIHVTPQMMPGEMSHHYSQPNSHQQVTTPGSGGIPSCGGPATTVPQSTYSTPEQQTQQFMSPQMAGMPASVSSVHSVHNNNSMEMVGGPASLQQHTPQQQYDIMGQMPQQDNNGMVVNNVSAMDQMMQQHAFNSPPMPMVVPQQPPQQPSQQQVPPQQQQQPQVQQQQAPQVPPTIPAPATT